jgi:hypothetical protein
MGQDFAIMDKYRGGKGRESRGMGRNLENRKGKAS